MQRQVAHGISLLSLERAHSSSLILAGHGLTDEQPMLDVCLAHKDRFPFSLTVNCICVVSTHDKTVGHASCCCLYNPRWKSYIICSATLNQRRYLQMHGWTQTLGCNLQSSLVTKVQTRAWTPIRSVDNDSRHENRRQIFQRILTCYRNASCNMKIRSHDSTCKN